MLAAVSSCLFKALIWLRVRRSGRAVSARVQSSSRQSANRLTTSPALVGDDPPTARLRSEVRQLVGMIERLRGDQARLTQENQRLMGEIDTLQSRLEAAEGVTGELTTLRDEREVIRGRVAEMLEQLEALSL